MGSQTPKVKPQGAGGEAPVKMEEMERLSKEIVSIMKSMDLPYFRISLECGTDDLHEILTCNIVRGRMLEITKANDHYDVYMFYSHTSTDCPNCDPEEIMRKDEESRIFLFSIKL